MYVCMSVCLSVCECSGTARIHSCAPFLFYVNANFHIIHFNNSRETVENHSIGLLDDTRRCVAEVTKAHTKKGAAAQTMPFEQIRKTVALCQEKDSKVTSVTKG